jgi:hypothetical protein
VPSLGGKTDSAGILTGIGVGLSPPGVLTSVSG